MSQTHVLKTWPVYFDAVQRGEKNFEVRRDDRGFQKGDIVRLERFDPEMGYTPGPAVGSKFSRLSVERRITWILTGGQFGIEPGYVVMGLEPRTPALAGGTDGGRDG